MANEKIIVVDDDAEFLEELDDMLSMAGYDVTGVVNGMEAIELARTLKPDLMLIDLKMKDVDGFVVSSLIKFNPELSGIPIVLMSGLYSLKERDWFYSYCKVNGFVRKPFNPVDVISKIENALKKNNSSNPPA